MPETHFYYISEIGKILTLASLSEAMSSDLATGYIWIDHCQPTKEDLTPLIDLLGLHPLAIEDCLDENQLPKVDEYGNHTFLIFNAFEYTPEEVLIYEVDAFLGERFLVTVSRNDSKGQPLINNVLKKVEASANLVQQGPAFLLHLIMDKIVDQKFLALDAIEDELDKYEETILTELADFKPALLLKSRKDLLTIRKSLFHEREILGKITHKDSPYIPDKAIYFYRDIHDHLTKFYELTENSRDLVTSLMEMYLSMLNNQMSRAANQTNAIVRRLTLITTIFMPLTLLSGIGGMSEYTMITGPENWRIAYLLLFLVFAVIAVINFILLRRLEKKTRDLDI